MFDIGLYVGLTFGIIIGMLIYKWITSPKKIKVIPPLEIKCKTCKFNCIDHCSNYRLCYEGELWEQA
jgi:hypothetical protein